MAKFRLRVEQSLASEYVRTRETFVSVEAETLEEAIEEVNDLMDGDEDDLSELGAKWKTKPAHKLQYRPEVEMTECTIEEAVPMLSDLDNGNPVVEPESLYLIHVWGDVDPELHGPFSNADERIAEAQKLHQLDPGALICMDFFHNEEHRSPSVYPFSHSELTTEDPNDDA